ncbi:MAG: RNA polymerase sigma factor [Phycisphaerales bacterium]
MSESILQRVARGDAEATRECVDRYADLVWSVARRLLGGGARVEAEDAVQEVFVDLWRSAGRFDPSVASEAAFVVMIARRRMIDRLRRRSRRIEEVSGSEWVEASVAGGVHPGAEPVSEDARRAMRAMEELSEEQRKVLSLAVQQGKTHTQIAEITGLPLGTVKTHVRRGLMRLRETLTAEAAS